MILNDKEILESVIQDRMIDPFAAQKVRMIGDVPAISYGLGHFGYDLRLSPKDFKIFQHIPGTVINPKQFNPKNLIDAELHHDEWGDYFIIPGHSYGLGVAMERLKIPNDITAIAIGKSTYARTALIINVTPSEAGWEGHLTIEISNSSPADVRVFANEGILQLLFLKGNPCNTAYGDGKYQQQGEQVTLARI
jgi:dCTP deaminase